MAANKTSSKPAKPTKKGSKLASLKSAIFGSAKKKGSAASPARPSSQKGPSKSEKVDMKDKKAHAPAAAPLSKVPSKKSASAPVATAPKQAPKVAAPAPAPAAKVGKGAAKAAAKQVAKASAAGSARVHFDANGEAVCREVACEGLATSAGYCRMHYIKNWKKIKRKEIILKEGKLNQYIEELCAKYPEKYIEAIRQDLANDKDFAKVIYDLDLDESVDEFSDVEGESLDTVIGDIKRDFDDEGESF